jgi:polyhydroxybutyrate depolymerase
VRFGICTGSVNPAGRRAFRCYEPQVPLRILILVLVLAGCAPAADIGTTAADGERTVTIAGRQRSYRVHVPSGATGRLPVVFVLHGGGGNGEQVDRQTGMSAAADRARFIAVFPNGSGRTSLLTWNAGRCCAYARREGVDDVAFLSAVLDEVLANSPADPGRVFVTGMSNGAMMAYRLACERSDRFAGIAPVAGALNVEPCQPAKPVSVLAVHGTADASVPYAGGPPVQPVAGESWINASVEDSVGFWAEHDRCGETPQQNRTGAVTVRTYAGCAAGTSVVLYTVDGGGHAWPGGTANRPGAAPAPPEPRATSVILDFFARLPARQ